jgi:hypothetical protein
MDLTKRSAYAFKFGERGGSRITSVPSRARKARNVAEYFVSRSHVKWHRPTSWTSPVRNHPFANRQTMRPEYGILL